MTDEKRAGMLEKIRALLAKADGTDFPEEAETFRAKAEALMLQYRIEVSELGKQHEDNVPVAEDRDFSWYWDNENGGYLWSVMQYCARHCRVKLVYWRAGSRVVPCVGLPSDIEYFDMLFTAAYLEFSKGLEPQPDPNKPLIENLVALKEAGQQWLRIAEQLRGIGQLTPQQFSTKDEIKARLEAENPGWHVYREEIEKVQKKMVHHLNFSGKYTKFCKDNERERLRVTPKMFQRSFAYGFAERIYERLAEARRAAKREMDQNATQASGMEVVLADIYTRAGHKAIEIYGPPPESKGRGGKGRQVSMDRSAMAVGAERANRVDIGNTKKITGSKGALPR